MKQGTLCSSTPEVAVISTLTGREMGSQRSGPGPGSQKAGRIASVMEEDIKMKKAFGPELKGRHSQVEMGTDQHPTTMPLCWQPTGVRLRIQGTGLEKSASLFPAVMYQVFANNIPSHVTWAFPKVLPIQP